MNFLRNFKKSFLLGKKLPTRFSISSFVKSPFPGCFKKKTIKKIYEGYVEKCTECGSKIELSDSVSEARVKDYEAEEDFEEKVKLFNRRVRNGYISIPIFMILCGVLGFVVASFELSRIGTIVALAVSFVVILITNCIPTRIDHFHRIPRAIGIR